MRIVLALAAAAVLFIAPAWAAGPRPSEPVPEWQYVLTFSFYHNGQVLSRQAMLLMDGATASFFAGEQSREAVAASALNAGRGPGAVTCNAAIIVYARQPWTAEDYSGGALADTALQRAYDAADHFRFGNLELALFRPGADWAKVSIKRLSMTSPHGVCLATYSEDMDPEILAMLEDCATLGVRLSIE